MVNGEWSNSHSQYDSHNPKLSINELRANDTPSAAAAVRPTQHGGITFRRELPRPGGARVYNHPAAN
jgi:hypothetical protein